MELVDGPSLADVLARGPLGTRRTMDTVAQVAAGLQAAHSAGLIHRDVKPANILFASNGGVRITDFGIAHAVGSTPVTSSGMVMGTPGYIAPERVSGAQTGPASDLYALGIVAYECLAGSQPFRGGALDVAIAHRDRPLPPLPASVPAEVAGFVMTLTAKDPAPAAGQRRRGRPSGGRLRDGLPPDADRTRPAPVPVPVPVPAAVPAGVPPTFADNPANHALAGVPSRPRRRGPWPWPLSRSPRWAAWCYQRHRFRVRLASARPPSHASSQAAPAATASSARTATPSATSSVRPDVSTSSPSAVKDTVTTPPGQRHHKKGHGNGNGNGNSQ